MTEIAGRSPAQVHLHRLSIAYQAASVGLIGLGMLWLVWMSIERQWPLVFLNACYMAAGVFLWLRVRGEGFRSAAALVHIFMFLVIVEICLIYDIPNEAAPRTTHLYLLAMAFLCYVTFGDTNPKATYGAVLVYLGGFVVFSSTSFSLPFSDPLPDDMRVTGGWIHSAVALGIMCVCVYIMQSDFAARSSYGRQLAAALTDDQLELHFQPQVTASGAIKGAEVLLRWRHPKRGLVPPDEFIPAAEQLGLMRPIGRWVLEAACAQLAAWESDPRKSGLRLAVNVSPQQFSHEDFVDEVKDAVSRHGIAPQKLELELTEGLVVSDFDDVIAKMNQLVAFGTPLALDDFGTGYSSLKYLKRMPFSQLKIDQAFVRDMLTDERDAALVRSIIQLGRELRLSVIAEGIETEQQRSFLASLGCGEFQGYLFGRPLPLPEFTTLLDTMPERAKAPALEG